MEVKVKEFIKKYGIWIAVGVVVLGIVIGTAQAQEKPDGTIWVPAFVACKEPAYFEQVFGANSPEEGSIVAQAQVNLGVCILFPEVAGVAVYPEVLKTLSASDKGVSYLVKIFKVHTSDGSEWYVFRMDPAKGA